MSNIRHILLVALIIIFIAAGGIYFISLLETKPRDTRVDEYLAAKEEADLNYLIKQLGDQDIPFAKREAAAISLQADYGKPALPKLIGCLTDERVYNPRRAIITGDMFNRPIFDPAPEPEYEAQTVGEKCEEVLYEILEAKVPPCPEPGQVNCKPRGRYYSVADWNQWWQDNKGKTLAEIQEMVRVFEEKALIGENEVKVPVKK